MTSTHAETVLITNPSVNAQSGWTPVLWGTKSSRTTTVIAPSTASAEAITMCSMPSTSTMIAAATT